MSEGEAFYDFVAPLWRDGRLGTVKAVRLGGDAIRVSMEDWFPQIWDGMEGASLRFEHPAAAPSSDGIVSGVWGDTREILISNATAPILPGMAIRFAPRSTANE